MQKRNQTSFVKNVVQGGFQPFNHNFFMTKPTDEINDVIINKQLEILEDAIKRYNRLEEVKKYTKMVLEDIDVVTEEDIKNALEIEAKLTIEDDLDVKKLLESEGLYEDIFGEQN